MNTVLLQQVKDKEEANKTEAQAKGGRKLKSGRG